MKMTAREVNFVCFVLIADPDIYYLPYCPDEVQDKFYYMRRKRNKFFKQYCKKKKIKYLGNGKILKI